MAKSSTSFTSSTAPKGKSKEAKTRVKEALGLTGWERLCNYILNEGSDKYIEEMMKLKGKDFNIAYNSLTEFVKPKLNRTTIVGDPETPLIPPSLVIHIVPPKA